MSPFVWLLNLFIQNNSITFARYYVFKIVMSFRQILISLLLCLFVGAYADTRSTSTTGLEGVVVDAQTRETLPFVQILFVGTTTGTTSNLDGEFIVVNNDGFTTLEFRMVGYKTQQVHLRKGHLKKQTIELEPDVYKLADVVIKPTRKRERYRRRGNPAVDLIKNVIARKGVNRVGGMETYSVESYEKLAFSLEPFDFNLDKNRFWKNFKFVEKYIDTLRVEHGVLIPDTNFLSVDTLTIGQDSLVINTDSVRILRDSTLLKANETRMVTLSVRETVADEYYHGSSRGEQKVVKAMRWEGFDKLFDNGGLTENMRAVFQPMNIFPNDINLLLNRFVSPLSSTLAVSYYHYYIMDTIVIDNTPCVDLAFVPVNSESFGFTGHLYIVADSTYALKKYSINVPPHINLNWVNHLSIEESFRQLPNGRWVSNEVNTYARFALSKRSHRNIYAHQTRYFSDYNFEPSFPDSLFRMAGAVVTLKDAKTKGYEEWEQLRPRKLTPKETMVDSMVPEFMRVPKFRRMVNTIQDLIQEYVPTTTERNKSKWDFGPVFNTFSYNEQEGCRFRIGGMTTANQHPRWFMNTYAAYGLNDKRFKGGITALYSFHDKEYHPYECLRHNLSLQLTYDLEELGQTYRVVDRDHILMSIKFNYKPLPMQYVARIRLKYEKEWANQLSIITWFDFMNNQPNGSLGLPNGKWAAPRPDRAPTILKYSKRNEDGTYLQRQYYHDAMWTFQLRYSPGGFIYNDRQGVESPFNLWKDAPVFRLINEMGYILEDDYYYNRIQLSAESRFWLSAFGHLDLAGDVGYVAGKKVPFTKLFIPASNNSILMEPKAFNLMQPMEFLMDRYVACHVIYNMKGWLFNRIPGIKLLKLREVMSFHILCGYLSDRNNPTLTPGLYDFPVSYINESGQSVYSNPTFSDGKHAYMPYMEFTVGIENIFKVLRVEYVRRLTHLQGLGPWQRNGIRIILRAAI